MLLFRTVREMFRLSPLYGALAISVSLLYLMQFILRIEITPLGYFSLYSDPTPAMPYYTQALPADEKGNPVNIYKGKGSSFLMYEILPTRFKILSESENCNQMGYKLRHFGIQLSDTEDCKSLRNFDIWFAKYAERSGLGEIYPVKEYGFLGGNLKYAGEFP